MRYNLIITTFFLEIKKQLGMPIEYRPIYVLEVSSVGLGSKGHIFSSTLDPQFSFFRMAVSPETVNLLRLFASTTTFLYLLLPALSLVYLYYRISRRRTFELLSKIDGPSGLPLFGNALEFIGDPHSKYEKITHVK